MTFIDGPYTCSINVAEEFEIVLVEKFYVIAGGTVNIRRIGPAVRFIRRICLCISCQV